MFCTRCGATLQEHGAYCNACGTPIKPLTETNSRDCRPRGTIQTPTTTLESNVSSEKDSADSLHRIIGSHADYYLPQFEAIKNNNPPKYNWAACLGGLFHAAYRGVWKQWVVFMQLPLAILVGSLVVAIIGAGLASQTAMLLAGALGILASIVSFVWQAILYPKQFNRIYFDHVKKKVSYEDYRPDPSAGRFLIATLACMALGVALSLITTFATVSMLGAAYAEESSATTEDIGVSVSESPDPYSEYADNDYPTYEETGNSLLEFLEQNYLDESYWISGTEYGSPSFTIQKVTDGSYTCTFHDVGQSLPIDEVPLDIEFLDGKAYGYVSFDYSDGQMIDLDLTYMEEEGMPIITLMIFGDIQTDIPDTYYCDAYLQ